MVAAACSSTSSSAKPGGSGASTTGCTVGVSWNNFQQPRWAAKDRPSMQKVVVDGGGIFLDFDANLSNTQQLTDVQTLINQGADVIVLLAQDDKAGAEVVKLATQNNIPVIAYDRLIEDKSVLYMSFNNTDVGFAEADAMLKKVPKGNYVLIKGDPGDANASKFLPAGWDKAGLKDKVASKDITIIGPADGTYTPPGTRPRPRTTWKRSSTRPTRPTRRSTRSWPRTTARRSASPLP
jgi:D-xylose transport system substrate-binding protein